MRFAIILALISSYLCCKAQNLFLLDTDTSITKKITSIHFDHSQGVIFPIDYAQLKFANISKARQTGFFVADANLINSVNTVLLNQYCDAEMRLDKYLWESRIDGAIDDREKKRLRNKMLSSEKHLLKFYTKIHNEIPYYDKQYIGFINSSGEHVILINLINFDNAPTDIRQHFITSWIVGLHGWFDTNVQALYFNVDKNLLTVDEEL